MPRKVHILDSALMSYPGGMTLDQVAAILGVSKQAVHQIERRALAKLRVRLRASISVEELKDFFNRTV